MSALSDNVKVAIIGRGNVASHLAQAMQNTSRDVAVVNPRTLDDLPADADVFIISVSDSAIADVAKMLKSKLLDGKDEVIVAHTSGSIEMGVLQAYFKNTGVFYPLQTFTKGKDMSYDDIPIFLEATDSTTMDRLTALASFSRFVNTADSHRREQLHLAAIFACNFVCRMLSMADEIMEKSGLDGDILKPLIAETVKKCSVMSPKDAQTGPAARGDIKAVESKRKLLTDYPGYFTEVYDAVSKSILETVKTT